MASQKSFPVAATIISFLPDEVGDPGLMLIACILCQQTQLVLDSVSCCLSFLFTIKAVRTHVSARIQNYVPSFL